METYETDTVVTSRIRLARNFNNYRFPSMFFSSNAGGEILDFVCNLFQKLNNFSVYRISRLSEIEKQSLIERYLISQKLALLAYGGVCINKDESISVMINEEDHIRAQSIVSGLNLFGAHKLITPIDALIMRNFRYAKDSENYLTACPSNYGTGLRASVMMFLPSLTCSNKIEKIFESAKSKHITCRGAFGEGSVAEGYWYQVSNSRTIGDVDELIENVERFALFVSDAENDERYAVYNRNKYRFEDEILRAYGILKHAKILEYGEFLQLIASVKLGCSLGIIKLKNPKALDDLVVTVRPSTLRLITKSGDLEELVRAEYVANALNIIGNN